LLLGRCLLGGCSLLGLLLGRSRLLRHGRLLLLLLLSGLLGSRLLRSCRLLCGLLLLLLRRLRVCCRLRLGVGCCLLLRLCLQLPLLGGHLMLVHHRLLLGGQLGARWLGWWRGSYLLPSSSIVEGWGC
jgi:hypothetical protein